MAMHNRAATTILPNKIVQSVVQIMHYTSSIVNYIANRSRTTTSRLAAIGKQAQTNHHNQTDNKILHTSSVKKKKKRFPKRILIIARYASKATLIL